LGDYEILGADHQRRFHAAEFHLRAVIAEEAEARAANHYVTAGDSGSGMDLTNARFPVHCDLMQPEMDGHAEHGRPIDTRGDVVRNDSPARWQALQTPDGKWLGNIKPSKNYKSGKPHFPTSEP